MATPPRLPWEILLHIIKIGVEEHYWTIPELFQARLVNTTFADEILTLSLRVDRLDSERLSHAQWQTMPERLKRLFLHVKIDQHESQPCALSLLVHHYLSARPAQDRKIQIQQLVDALVPVNHEILAYLGPSLHAKLMRTSPFYRQNQNLQSVQLQIALARDAISRNDPVALQNLLEDGEDAGKIHIIWSHLFDGSPLCLAAQKGTREIMETLLLHGTWTGGGCERGAIKKAIRAGNRAVLDVWLDDSRLSRRSETVPSTTFFTAFLEFVRVGDFEMVEYLSPRYKRYGSDFAEMHFIAFIEAINVSNVVIVEWLHDHGEFDINETDGYHETALFAALLHCEPAVKIAMVKMLLDRGTNPNGQHPRIQGTPLQVAIRQDATELIDLLLDHGADPIARTSRGIRRHRTRLRYPLLYAARKGNLWLVRRLLECGASPLVVFWRRTLTDEAKAGRVAEEVREMLVEFVWAERYDKWVQGRKARDLVIPRWR
ncbi:ankyrin repeat-containing domain protein [Aspergillus keveii]|uniref:Ankyrin repeat-containing domain protein n=1 Tax=Aspergillus keveii TaxID=714993 RepID=A0ABR4FYF9_9EURO